MVEEFVKVCRENDVAEGSIKNFNVDGKSIALARYKGAIYAVDDVCTHDGGDLGGGDIIDGQVQCPRHGARFDLKTGEATQMPAVMGIKTYRVKIEDGDVLIASED
jgi:3-phenylpropionate/trans-cinnamate dioxygenase ferredoxin subunit